MAWRKARLKSLENDAIQAQFVIQKMSELTTQEKESSDDLEPISEASPSKTLDEDQGHESSSDDNDETLGDDDAEAVAAGINENNDNNPTTNLQTLDTANANSINFRNVADNDNNIPVEKSETSEEGISHELTNPPEAIHEEVVETTEIKETEQLEHFEHEESPSASASSRSSPTPSTKSSRSSSSPVSSSEEIKDDVQSDEE